MHQTARTKRSDKQEDQTVGEDWRWNAGRIKG